MEQNIITFSGDNDKLFSKVKLENFDAKTTLIVPETHNAILIKDGQMLQTLVSGKYLISDFIDLQTEVDAVVDVLFMSKTAKLKLLWGTAPKILMYDAVLQDDYKLGVSGDFEVQVGDPRKCYLYLVGASEILTADALQERLMSKVVSVLEAVIIEYVKENKVLFNQISVYKKDIASKTLTILKQKMMNEYGIAVFSFSISNVIIDEKDSERLNNLNKMVKNKKESVCSVCGTVLKEGAKFCFECGSKVDKSTKCPLCLAENVEGAKFCSSCGTKL